VVLSTEAERYDFRSACRVDFGVNDRPRGAGNPL